MKGLQNIGDYFIMMNKVMSRPEKRSVFLKQFNLEIMKIILSSIGIVIIISFFIGAVVAIQQYFNLSSPLFPDYTIGLVTRDAVILEFAPTMLGLILAGKVGSSITSEIGTMRVTEQIDALEIMGINSASFLILPKILVSVIFFPILIILSISIGIIGGWLGGLSVGVPTSQFILGIQYEFIPFYVTYSLIKSIVFAFIITSVSAYYGYHASGGAINVGKASTKAVVYSSIIILIFNYILTDLILSGISF
ncbi:MAG: ABC transporter permease [Flavobacteriales bacterium]|nr:ABC transporter permease [Flavobacteriales bacterium]MBT5698728.1 ABC transporter permease [Flavobacteriales bacterium]MBT6699229.1 ABC transporter permease [Flavobacteriales bacterium]MBT6814877.1 ABC transporter permease [Flavobacteriales bacterium]MBT7620246.1 ABC transporter permease [Flavobacteriales bacterium]